ncbi:hypothetical protein BU17DRAFT_68354 [Hysterangium stoloniferum]|nr:hypothetical protein BU17DRAFT_68354 [Hysterangium stoloniferum]
MASKQLGKLRQWGREVISSKDKTVLTEEFKQVEQDVELRRTGIQRLYTASGEYHGYLHKKKEYPDVEEGVKMLAVDALGAVMMSHGEDFGDDSAFGQCLIRFGRAHCKIATLQESFSQTFRDTYLASLARSLEELDDYSTQRKKLDSRRLAYDAAVTKANKAKKEKEVKEADEELNKAKLRYEETSTDVQARVRLIQENEIEQLRDLTDLLANEIQYVSRYLDVLKDTQDEWLDESNIQRPDVSQPKLTPYAFAFGRPAPSISSTSRTSTPVRSGSAASSRGRASLDSDADADEFGTTVRRRASPVNTPRPSSRGSVGSAGTAQYSRRRGDSVGSEGTKRSGVASWASSAVSSLSVPGLGKKEAKKDKDKSASRAFASLENASDGSEDGGDLRARRAGAEEGLEEETQRQAFGSSFGSLSLGKVLSQKPIPSQSSSSGSSFTSVSAPSSSVNASQRSRIPPPVPVPPQRTLTEIARRAEMDITSEDGASILSQDMFDPHVAVRVYDEPFGDHHFAKSPMSIHHEHYDPATEDEDDEKRGLFDPAAGSPALPTATSPQGMEIGNMAGNGALDAVSPPKQPPALPQRRQSVKKAPPPPPARRITTGAGGTVPMHSATGSISSSAPVSTVNLTLGAPGAPALPRRPISRIEPITDSPFEN